MLSRVPENLMLVESIANGGSSVPPFASANRYDVATHDQVPLRIVAKHEGMSSCDVESPFSIERDGSRVPFPHSEPQHGRTRRLDLRKNMRHELVSQPAPMVRRIDIEPLDLDRSLARDQRGLRIEPQLHESSQFSV